jgi:hypothetical protein
VTDNGWYCGSLHLNSVLTVADDVNKQVLQTEASLSIAQQFEFDQASFFPSAGESSASAK